MNDIWRAQQKKSLLSKSKYKCLVLLSYLMRLEMHKDS